MAPVYGEGDVLTLMSVLVSVFVEVAGDGFTIVVLLSFFSAGGFVTVVSFCSQATRSARPVSRQIYFLIQKNRVSERILSPPIGLPISLSVGFIDALRAVSSLG